MNRRTFQGFKDGSGFYKRFPLKSDEHVRVRTYAKLQDAVTFAARSVHCSPNLVARATDGDVSILDADAKLLPGAVDELRKLLGPEEAALLALFATPASPPAPRAMAWLEKDDTLLQGQRARLTSPLGLAWRREVDAAQEALERCLFCSGRHEEEGTRAFVLQKVTHGCTGWIYYGMTSYIDGLTSCEEGEAGTHLTLVQRNLRAVAERGS